MHLQLKTTTRPDWLNTVLANFNTFLQDHAACERKASAMAMSMLAHYPDKPELVRAMINLAIEEMHHFKQVVKIMHQRNIPLGADVKDPYIQALQKQVRNGREQYFLDRLLVASIVEARGHERFCIIAEGHTDETMRNFYQKIAESEARHYEDFLQLAEQYFSPDLINPRLEQLLTIEAEIVDGLEFRAAVH